MGKVLYLGIDPSHYKTERQIFHLPLVKVIPRPYESIEITSIFARLKQYTHVIFGSKNSVLLFFENFRKAGYKVEDLSKIYLIAVGSVPAYYIRQEGFNPTYISADTTGDGVIRVLNAIDLSQANVLLPKSSSARPALAHFLVEHEVKHQILILYDMCDNYPTALPELSEIDEIVFTTPKAVDVFFSLFHDLPDRIDLHPLGTVTREYLRQKLLHLDRKVSI